MKHLPNRKAPTAEYWSDTYTDSGKWGEESAALADRRLEAMTLIGDPVGKTFLDLGGGPLLGKRLFAAGAKRVVVVDFAQRALDIVKALEPRVETVCGDAIEYLHAVVEQFDVTIAMGILDYLPPTALKVIFDKAPSKWLLLYTPTVEGVLEYETRVTAYTRTDIAIAAEHWKLLRSLPTRESVFALYCRRR